MKNDVYELNVMFTLYYARLSLYSRERLTFREVSQFIVHTKNPESKEENNIYSNSSK